VDSAGCSGDGGEVGVDETALRLPRDSRKARTKDTSVEEAVVKTAT